MIANEVAREVAKNAAMSIPAIRNRRLRRPRAGVRFTGREDELERYAFLPLRIISETVGRDVRGKSVLEIGPGDYLTSGMSLLAAGASSYTSIDRFVGDYSQLEGKDWYRGIEAAWPRIHPDLPWPAWLSARDFPEGYTSRVRVLDIPIERAKDIGRFDVVCSFQVGEHVTDIEAFARASSVMLNPGGVAVHRVDFGPHGGWLRFADPLTFLRVPEPLWRLMGANRGLVNRRRLHELVAAFDSAGLSVEISAARRIDLPQRQAHTLPPRYRQMPTESLATLDAVLVCRRMTDETASH